MTNKDLPSNVFSLRQPEFRAIPGSPWVYWVNPIIRHVFRSFPPLGHIGKPTVGLQTGDNSRFIRYWWEVGTSQIGFSMADRRIAKSSNKKWFPYMKGGGYGKWYGNQYYVVNWYQDGYEIQNFYGSNGRLASRPQNTNYYFKKGVTYSYLTSSAFSARYSPSGFIFDVAGSSLFPENPVQILGVLNSSYATYILKLLNPTVNFQVGDLARIPINNTRNPSIENIVKNLILKQKNECGNLEFAFDFIAPQIQKNTTRELEPNEIDLDKKIFELFGLSEKDREAILIEQSENIVLDEEEKLLDDRERASLDQEMVVGSQQDNEVSWISFALGIILGRFQPGTPGALGSATYRRSDFAIGSFPEPSEEEFNELVGDPSQFAYIDEQGGRHVFSYEVEQALQQLDVPDGITVFDAGHPRDLPTLVSKALELMLGQAQAQEVIQQAAGGDLRKFLEKDFFTQHHIKQYRKRPVYWPIQSSRRSYGFVLFHEKIDRNTFYALQQEPYLPTKRRAVQLRLEELGKKVLTAQGAARKPIEKEMDELRQLAEELAQFAKDLEAITRGGYEPEADWIDDGVILRMAPLWSVIPLWKSEPKKYWEELAAGKYDWSRIAMKYWPERVKQACKKNKSYAIAHGHEEWYKGK